MKLLYLVFALACLPILSYSQTQQDNAFAPAEKEQAGARKKSMKKKGRKTFREVFKKQLDQKVKEFEKRMTANVKEDRKARRLMEKPQYSDPSYFGHKRKPKKRPLKKRKFCKECHIWH